MSMDVDAVTAVFSADESLESELARLLQGDQHGRAIQLLELNAMRTSGEITETQFAQQRAALYDAG